MGLQIATNIIKQTEKKFSLKNVGVDCLKVIFKRCNGEIKPVMVYLQTYIEKMYV